jgi:hypothetical protein
MEIFNLVLCFCHILSQIIFLIKRNGNIIDHVMRIKMSSHIILHLLLLWRTHLNILHITSSYWPFYLLKYAMKCEPLEILNLDT